MARQRWTLALILICLPILATVITAFRVRDLPKSSHDITKKEKCIDCDVKVGNKLHSVNKIASDKRTHEELKQAVREKQQAINNKLPDSKPNYKYESKSEEDDDDDEIDFLKLGIGFRQEHIKVSKDSISLKQGTIKSSDIDTDDNFDNDDDDDDENNDDKVSDDGDDIDDDDDEDDEYNDDDYEDNKVIKSTNINEKLDTTHKKNFLEIKKPILNNKEKTRDNNMNTNKKIELKHTKRIDYDDDEDDDDDDDNDDEVNNSFRVLSLEKKNDIESKQEHELKKNSKPIQKLTEDKFHEGKVNDDKKMYKTSDNLLKKDTITILPKSQPKEKKTQDKEMTSKKILVEPAEDEGTKVKEKTDSKSKLLSEDKKIDLHIKELKSDTKQKATVPVKDDHIVEKLIKNKIKDPPKGTTKDQIEKNDKVLQESIIKIKSHEIDDHKSKSFLEKEDKHESIKEAKIVKQKYNSELKKKDNVQKESFKFLKSVNSITDKENTDKDLTEEEATNEKLLDSEEISTKSESHLKHVTDTLQRRNLLKSEFEDFYAFFPTFAPNFSRIHNPECRRHGQIVLRQLRGMKLWALNMLDATAKIPSSILQGNGIQLGDFDQCMGSRARVQLETGSIVKVQGKYCLAQINVKAEHPELEVPVYLAQAKNLIRSRIDDPGHFVPRFSTLSWGVCVPSSCNSEDVEVVIKDAIKHYQHTSGVVVRIKVDEKDCHTESGTDWWEDWLELPTLLTLSFYGVVILLVFVATIQDYFARKTPENESENEEKSNKKDAKDYVNDKSGDNTKTSESIIGAFSLYQTINKLIAPGTTDEISCIHGIRAIATVALLIAHKFLPVAVMPYTNRLQVTETASSPLWSWCRAGWMYTDCFLLLSGALTAHRMSNNDTPAPQRLLSRYLRLSPALLAVLLFYAYVWDNLSSGPMWGTFVTKNAEVCQEGWWWNLLYVQNYFGFEEMCAPQTHQLALDMQLTIFGGFIVWMAQVKPGFLTVLIPGLHTLAAYSRYTTVRDHRLTLLAYHGVSVSQLYRTARLSYASTWHRSTSYLIGLTLGLTLRKPSEHGKILLTFGWILSAALWSLVWWAGIDSGSLQYRYSATFAAQYAAFAPIASSVAIAWVIYAVHNGSCDFLSRLLCCRPLVFISRLSYALYLCQFIVYITSVATVKTSREFTLMSLIDVQEISYILLSSTILTLTFVIPMQSLHKAFSFKSKTDTIEDIKVSNGPEPIIEEPQETITKIKKRKEEVPQLKSFLAHREVLEEIPETEIEYEIERERSDGLDEILEEEEGDLDDYSHNNLDEDMEIIEEEGGEEVWPEREEYLGRPSNIREDDQDLDEWEWTANGRSGAQLYRYSR